MLSNEAILKRQEEILSLMRKGNLQNEIADIMQLNASVICRCIKDIDPKKVETAKKEGEQKRMQIKNDAELQKQEQILSLLRDNKSEGNIAKAMGVSKSTICRWIKGIDPKKVEAAKDESKKKTEEQLVKLKKDKKIQGEIAKIVGVSKSTICRRMEKIELKITEEQREKQILELIEAGKSQEKIANIMEVSIPTIRSWIKDIEPIKVEKAKSEAKERRQKRILDLKKDGKTLREIAEIMEISVSLVKQTIKANKAQEKYYNELKQKLDEQTITNEEISAYRNYLDRKYNKIQLKEVLLMVNMYTKSKRINECIEFLNSLIMNEEMRYLGRDKLIEARDEAKRIEKIQIARQLLRENNIKQYSEIARMTGLNEIEVIRIKKQMQEEQR